MRNTSIRAGTQYLQPLGGGTLIHRDIQIMLTHGLVKVHVVALQSLLSRVSL